MEITSLLGSVSTKNGETYLHLHINLCWEDMSVIGGHLNECRISATCAMILRKIDGTVERRLDYPALSRQDNRTEICPDCGIREALGAAGISPRAKKKFWLR